VNYLAFVRGSIAPTEQLEIKAGVSKRSYPNARDGHRHNERILLSHTRENLFHLIEI
jgi:hypothetical protein